MTARGDSLGYSRNPGSNYYAGLTHQLMIDLDADDAARVSAFHFAVGRQSRWQTTMEQSDPDWSIDTFGLADLAACAFSLHISNQVLKFRTKARMRVTPPAHRTPHGQ